jgi:hypothetical protein
MESIAKISSILESGKFSTIIAKHDVTNRVIARELTLDAAQATRGARSSRPLDRHQIKKLLDSRNDREVQDGLRRVLAVGPPLATTRHTKPGERELTTW